MVPPLIGFVVVGLGVREPVSFPVKEPPLVGTTSLVPLIVGSRRDADTGESLAPELAEMMSRVPPPSVRELVGVNSTLGKFPVVKAVITLGSTRVGGGVELATVDNALTPEVLGVAADNKDCLRFPRRGSGIRNSFAFLSPQAATPLLSVFATGLASSGTASAATFRGVPAPGLTDTASPPAISSGVPPLLTAVPVPRLSLTTVRTVPSSPGATGRIPARASASCILSSP
jgi:hypothetical protein